MCSVWSKFRSTLTHLTVCFNNYSLEICLRQSTRLYLNIKINFVEVRG